MVHSPEIRNWLGSRLNDLYLRVIGFTPCLIVICVVLDNVSFALSIVMSNTLAICSGVFLECLSLDLIIASILLLVVTGKLYFFFSSLGIVVD